MSVLMRNSGQKRYSVICLDPDSLPNHLVCSIEVYADSKEGAKMIAEIMMHENGHPNARVALEQNGAQVVMEIPVGNGIIVYPDCILYM